MATTAGQAIRNLRQEAGIMIGDMANFLSITPRKLAQIENGDIQPTVTQLEKIGDLFAMSVQDIVSNKKQRIGIRASDLRQLGTHDLEMMASLNRIVRNTDEMTTLLRQHSTPTINADGNYLDAETAGKISDGYNHPQYEQEIDRIVQQVTESIREAATEGKRSIDVNAKQVRDGLWPYAKHKLEHLGYTVSNLRNYDWERTGARVSW